MLLAFFGSSRYDIFTYIVLFYLKTLFVIIDLFLIIKGIAIMSTNIETL